jgi:hypothetical protein
MEYRYRIDRAWDFVDRVITEERAIADILDTARCGSSVWPSRACLG